MRWDFPWIWLALPPLLVWVWWLSGRSYAQLSPTAKWGTAGIRALVLALLIGSLSQPILLRHAESRHVLFILDASPSISRENAEAALTEVDRLARSALGQGEAAQKGAAAATRVSVIAFGQRPRIMIDSARVWEGWNPEQREQILYESSLPVMSAQRAKAIAEGAPAEAQKPLSARIAEVERFRDEVAGDQTDPAAAIRLALNCGAAGEARTIYLLTDANFTAGDWRAALDTAALDGQEVRTVALDKPGPPEVAATDVTLPVSVRVNEAFEADIRIASTLATTAKIAVFTDGYAAAELTQELRPGENTVRAPGLFFRAKGFHTVEAAVRAESDTRMENNTAAALVMVPGELRVLYVDSDESQQSYLSGALEMEGVQVECRPAAGVPRALEGLLSFDAFILSNVPADKLSARQMQMIKAYVQDFGGGFVMLGGDQSFGLGGYSGTPVEEVLPVRMPIRKDLNRPSLAIVLVIDKSGSMEGPKIQLAKRAAVATAEAINPRDQIGIIGFDSDSRVILDLTAAGERSNIQASIASLEAGGGTFLYPALEMAQAQLQGSNAKKKHIIVLTDGQTEGYGYAEFAQSLASEGITISTVGIGQDADMRLLEAMAAAGEGRSYFTNDFYSIPQIFTREALRASNSMLVERVVVPVVNEADETIGELDAEELPPLSGYVATTPKETAKVIITSDSGDPLLAKWRSGLGRTAAFTSDTKPRWAEDWIRWPDFAKFWVQVIRSVAGREVNKEISLEARAEALGEQLRLTADLRDATGGFVSDRTPELSVYNADTGVQKLEVVHEAPGLYSAIVPLGAYHKSQQFAWHAPGEADANSPNSGARGQEDLTAPVGFVRAFSPEFRTLGPDRATLDDLARRCGGCASRVGETKLALASRSSVEELRLWPLLLAAALVLVPIDILWRRLG